MTTPCIISVAITGSVPRKKDNPAVPVTIAEQVESTHEAYEAGATLVHLHVRDENENSSSDRSSFEKLQDGIRKHCPDIIIQFSTGGRGRSFEQRGAMLDLRPDMASLATGSVNFPTTVYENPPDFVRALAKSMLDYDVKAEIEIFDLAMLYATANLVQEGLLKSPVHVQFVFGIKNALPARREILEFEVKQLKALLPDATWTAAGIGRTQLEVNHWTLEMGGHCRTGLEDNVRWDKDTLATSNAQLVERVAKLCGEYGRPVATPKQARDMLKLKPL
ncbi:3-keto-5-aminohexanoate cleavage protein [Paraburkholderia sp.]|uniref:3-keto-5-aminohexanoate cleavage protein n=1 Tax=Paraburkholderia sp. TaxID=1926495 RepID=UPI002382B6E0|nr:3-keto-5-aminohexanoate cleavage protein [Paraburkholderia sp.]MDE1179260.1 3-keto-5-aminohexanoate cleavage protein [Paraburkholderia sp.]